MSAMDAFWAAPPVTRTLTAAAVLLSVPVWSGLVAPYYVVFIRQAIFKLPLPQLWRLITPFLLTGPQFGLLLDPYFLWTYGKALETGSSRFNQPGDFLTFLVFVSVFILLTAGLVLNAVLFLQPLTLALAYLYGQENPNLRMTFYIVTFRARYLPYAMLAMTFVMSGPPEALNQATGLLAAHAYDFLTRLWPEYGGGRRVINTPQIVRGWFAKPGTSAQTRGYGTAFQAGGRQQPAANVGGGGGGWTSGFRPGAWGGRGQGRRLGGD